MLLSLSKRIFCKIAAIAVVLGSIFFASNATSQQNHMKDTYLIDNKNVSKKEFEVFLAKLKEVPGTWFCAETNKGGVTGYDTKDHRGVLYSYKSESSPNGTAHTLSLKRN